MFTPNELEAIPVYAERLFKDLEDRIMADVIRRLRNNGNQIIRSADWQLNRLYELGKSKAETKEDIKQTLELSDSEIDRIYDDVIKSGYARNEDIYKSAGKDFIAYDENLELQQLVKSIATQTKDEFKNITGSLGFAVRQFDGSLKYLPVAEYYQKTLDDGLLDISTGTFDYNTVLKRTVKEMTDSGLRYIDYASGWHNRVDVAARRALMTGFNQVVSKVNEDNAEMLETNTFEISWHSGHRPSHWWGGQWFIKEQLVSICGLGQPDGLCGCNCYHSYRPVIPGVSVPTYTQEQLAKMEEEENKKVEYNGKYYTKYEALQRQRRLETRMRAQRQRIKLLQEGNASEDDIISAKVKYRTTSDEYVRFSKAMDLPQQRERVTVDGLKNIGNVKIPKTVANSADSGIIELAREMERREKNIGAFSNFKIPMQKRYVLEYCKKYNIDTKGLTFKIHRSESLLKLKYFGMTDYNNIGRIDLLPNAFIDEEQLIRTVLHEKCHVKQLKKYGKKYVQANLSDMERKAYKFEDVFYNILKRSANK